MWMIKICFSFYIIIISSFYTAVISFQLLFFFSATYALLTRNVSGQGWLKSACMIYSTHTTTTLVPMLGSIIAHAASDSSRKILLFIFYFPYFIFPLWLSLIAAVSKDFFNAENKEVTTHAKSL
jgi:hypothetical protein